jgi:hypothetical protein
MRLALLITIISSLFIVHGYAQQELTTDEILQLSKDRENKREVLINSDSALKAHLRRLADSLCQQNVDSLLALSQPVLVCISLVATGKKYSGRP